MRREWSERALDKTRPTNHPSATARWTPFHPHAERCLTPISVSIRGFQLSTNTQTQSRAGNNAREWIWCSIENTQCGRKPPQPPNLHRIYTSMFGVQSALKLGHHCECELVQYLRLDAAMCTKSAGVSAGCRARQVSQCVRTIESERVAYILYQLCLCRKVSNIYDHAAVLAERIVGGRVIRRIKICTWLMAKSFQCRVRVFYVNTGNASIFNILA